MAESSPPKHSCYLEIKCLMHHLWHDPKRACCLSGACALATQCRFEQGFSQQCIQVPEQRTACPCDEHHERAIFVVWNVSWHCRYGVSVRDVEVILHIILAHCYCGGETKAGMELPASCLMA